eukprot:Skav222326  [mRNA]  locus=scaffold1249:299618:303857:- [translate_table: standard]
MVIINAPRVFGIAWSFVKPQLDEKTVAKISIFGSDQREDPLSCMRAVKGPWADPEVLQCLEEHPLEKILTPEGAKLLVEAERQAAAILAEYQEVDEAPPSFTFGMDKRLSWILQDHMKTLTDWVAEFNALTEETAKVLGCTSTGTVAEAFA